jgi:sporulation protein YunB
MKKNIFIATLLLCVIITIIVLKIISIRVSPILMNYAELETKKLSSIVINRAVNKQLANGMNIDEMFNIIKNDNGEIATIDFNPAIVNKVLNTTTNVVLINLKAIEEGNIDFIELPDILISNDKDKLKNGIIYEIPLGTITNSGFLSNLGPKIPIKLNIIGSVESNVKTNIKEYGINNALVEIYIRISVTEQINVPFISKRVTVTSDIPVALKVIQGSVPKYYGGTLSKQSNIFSIPIEENN